MDGCIFREIRKLGIREVMCILDKGFMSGTDTFQGYLASCYDRLAQIDRAGIYSPVVYNVDAGQFLNCREYFHFFMCRGATRFIVPNLFVNPVAEHDIFKEWDITAYPDYNVYQLLLNLQASAAKYKSMRIYGNDLIIRLQNYIFNRKYLKPALACYDAGLQMVFDARRSRIIRRKSEPLAKKCGKCSYMYLCGKNYLKTYAACPPCEAIIQAVGKRLNK